MLFNLTYPKYVLQHADNELTAFVWRFPPPRTEPWESSTHSTCSGLPAQPPVSPAGELHTARGYPAGRLQLDRRHQRQGALSTKGRVKQHHKDGISKINVMGNFGTNKPISPKLNCKRKIVTWESMYWELIDAYQGQGRDHILFLTWNKKSEQWLNIYWLREILTLTEIFTYEIYLRTA